MSDHIQNPYLNAVWHLCCVLNFEFHGQGQVYQKPRAENKRATLINVLEIGFKTFQQRPF